MHGVRFVSNQFQPLIQNIKHCSIRINHKPEGDSAIVDRYG
jgi:hypothetical protein